MATLERRHRGRWAPWWVYVIAIVATNLIRTRWLMPAGLATWLEVIIGVGSIALVVVVVTAAYRVSRS